MSSAARITVMARSALQARWLAPRPSVTFEERSLRFVPADRPVLLQFGALDRTENLLAGMSPLLQMPLQNAVSLPLLDDGLEWDFLPGDGTYTAVYPDPLVAGTYALQLELPRANGQPVRLQKRYEFAALPLPGLALRLQVDEGFGVGDTLNGVVFLSEVAGVDVLSLADFTLVVRDGSGRLTYLEPRPVNAVINPDLVTEAQPTATATRATGGGPLIPPLPQITLPDFVGRGDRLEGELFSFSYTPPQPEDTYTFQAIANLNAEIDDEPIPYVDFAVADFRFALPRITISAAESEIRQSAGQKATLRLIVSSASGRDETVRLLPLGSGLEGLTLEPDEIVIPAGQADVAVLVDLYSANLPGTAGELRLDIVSPEQTALIANETGVWNVSVSTGIGLTPEAALVEIVRGEGGAATIRFQSSSPRDEILRVSIVSSDGLTIDDILPARVIIPAAEETQVTFKVYSASPAGTRGRFVLRFESDDDGVILNQNEVSFDAAVVGGLSPLTLFACAGVLLALLLTALLVVRRRRRR